MKIIKFETKIIIINIIIIIIAILIISITIVTILLLLILLVYKTRSSGTAKESCQNSGY